MLTPDELAEVIGAQVDAAMSRELEARAALASRVAVLEARAADAADGAKTLGALGERVAGLEARPIVPGPAGKDGDPGAAGADGLGFGDLVVEQISDREFWIKAIAGDRERELGRVVLPVPVYRDVWAPGRRYERGDAVTYGGSLWISQANGVTARPETAEGAGAWRLAVKRGDRGRA